MSIERLVLHRVDVPLVRPFRTSFGTETARDLILVEAVSSDGLSGWGECVAMDWPGYSPEYTDGAIDVIERFLLPRLAGITESTEPAEIRARMAPILGHAMARAAVETALLDLWLRHRAQSLADYLGAVVDRVDCGVSVGIPTSESITNCSRRWPGTSPRATAESSSRSNRAGNSNLWPRCALNGQTCRCKSTPTRPSTAPTARC